MAATRLGTCLVVFVDDGEEIAVDLLLTGPAMVERQPLVAGSPFSLSFQPYGDHRDAVRHLTAWAEGCEACLVDVRLTDRRALLRLDRDRVAVTGELTDLDVLFADAADREHH